MRVAATENVDIGKMDKQGMQDALHLMNREKILASNKLAIDMQQNMLASVREEYKDVSDNGVRSGPFWVLVGAQMPAVLIELGFISHPREATRMVDHRYQQKLAMGIANGVDRYFDEDAVVGGKEEVVGFSNVADGDDAAVSLICLDVEDALSATVLAGVLVD